MKKWISLAFAVGVLVGIFIPKYSSEYDKLVDVAEMQAVKIAIIEQASKLQNYTNQLAAQQEPNKDE